MNTTSENKAATDATMAKRLSEHPFLRRLNHTQLALLADCALTAQFKPGDVIFRESEKAQLFYLIEKGKVVLESGEEYGEPVAIQTIGAGDLLGWSWMLPPYRWRFTARAIEPTEAIYFAGTILRDYCERDHSLGFELHKRISEVMMKRLQAARQKMLSMHAHGEELPPVVLQSPFMDQELDIDDYVDPNDEPQARTSNKEWPPKLRQIQAAVPPAQKEKRKGSKEEAGRTCRTGMLDKKRFAFSKRCRAMLMTMAHF